MYTILSLQLNCVREIEFKPDSFCKRFPNGSWNVPFSHSMWKWQQCSKKKTTTIAIGGIWYFCLNFCENVNHVWQWKTLIHISIQDRPFVKTIFQPNTPLFCVTWLCTPNRSISSENFAQSYLRNSFFK